MLASTDEVAREISLRGDKVALVSECDFERVASLRWRAVNTGWNTEKWYATRTQQNGRRRVTVQLHRFILNAQDCVLVDHINGNGLDCRRSNLRFADAAENRWNANIRFGRSPYRGVTFDQSRTRNPWVARLAHRGNRFLIGRFQTEQEAAIAWDAKAREMYGAFARLNFP